MLRVALQIEPVDQSAIPQPLHHSPDTDNFITDFLEPVILGNYMAS